MDLSLTSEGISQAPDQCSLLGIPKLFIYCLNVGIGRVPRIPPTLQFLFGQRILGLREVRTGLGPQKMAAPLGLDLWVLKLGG